MPNDQKKIMGPGGIELDPIKTRLVQLGFKRATEGLTPEEEKELADLKRKQAMQNAMAGNNS